MGWQIKEVYLEMYKRNKWSINIEGLCIHHPPVVVFYNKYYQLQTDRDRQTTVAKKRFVWVGQECYVILLNCLQVYSEASQSKE